MKKSNMLGFYEDEFNAIVESFKLSKRNQKKLKAIIQSVEKQMGTTDEIAVVTDEKLVDELQMCYQMHRNEKLGFAYNRYISRMYEIGELVRKIMTKAEIEAEDRYMKKEYEKMCKENPNWNGGAKMIIKNLAKNRNNETLRELAR